MQGRVQGGSQGIQSISRILGPIMAAWFFGIWKGLPYTSAILLFTVSLIFLISAIPTIHSHHVKDA
jgi:hypothetical protein